MPSALLQSKEGDKDAACRREPGCRLVAAHSLDSSALSPCVLPLPGAHVRACSTQMRERERYSDRASSCSQVAQEGVGLLQFLQGRSQPWRGNNARLDRGSIGDA